MRSATTEIEERYRAVAVSGNKIQHDTIAGIRILLTLSSIRRRDNNVGCGSQPALTFRGAKQASPTQDVSQGAQRARIPPGARVQD